MTCLSRQVALSVLAWADTRFCIRSPANTMLVVLHSFNMVYNCRADTEQVCYSRTQHVICERKCVMLLVQDQTPLHFAAQDSGPDVIEALLRHGANLYAVNANVSHSHN